MAIDRPLLSYLRKVYADQTVGYRGPPRLITHAADTRLYEIELETDATPSTGLVLRIFRDPDTQERAWREAVIQDTLADAGYPAARVISVGRTEDGLGAPFLLMERLPGAPLLARLGSLGDDGGFHIPNAKAILREAKMLPFVPRMLAEAQHRLHRIPTSRLTAALREHSIMEDALSVDARLLSLAQAVDRWGIDELTHVLMWLHRRRPTERSRVICHCDAQPLNVLTSSRGELTGVVDWSWAMIGEPELDIGFTRAAFDTAPVQGPAFLEAPLRFAQRRFSSSYLGAYRRLGELDPRRVKYYEVLRCALAIASVTRRRAGDRYEWDAVWDSEEGLRGLRTFLGAVTDARSVRVQQAVHR